MEGLASTTATVLPVYTIAHRHCLRRGEMRIVPHNWLKQLLAAERVGVETRLAVAVHSQPLSRKLEHLKHLDL